MRIAASSLLFTVFLFSCSPNNVKQDKSLKKYFDENKVGGCFALMDNATGKFTVYNLSRYRDSSYLPASTFKIVNSLIGLQTGKIVNDSMVIKWDGVQRRVEDWNKDLTMYEAFRVSSVYYYQEVVKRAMLFEDNANYRLGYKTGWGFTEKGHALGWVVGWIEENKHPYFFVLNVESPDKDFDMKPVRIKMLRDILKQLGFFNGKM